MCCEPLGLRGKGCFAEIHEEIYCLMIFLLRALLRMQRRSKQESSCPPIALPDPSFGALVLSYRLQPIATMSFICPRLWRHHSPHLVPSRPQLSLNLSLSTPSTPLRRCDSHISYVHIPFLTRLSPLTDSNQAPASLIPKDPATLSFRPFIPYGTPHINLASAPPPFSLAMLSCAHSRLSATVSVAA